MRSHVQALYTQHHALFCPTIIMIRSKLTYCTAVLTAVITVCGCKQTGKQQAQAQENLRAKAELAGIWIDAEEETAVFKIKGDTVYYPDTTDTALFRRQLKINYETVYEIMCRTEAERSGCTVVNFLDGRLETPKGKFSGYCLSKRLAAEATVCFASASGRNRYYGIAPKALLPPVIAERSPDSRKKWRFTGTDVLKPVFDEILSGRSPSGTVFTV